MIDTGKGRSAEPFLPPPGRRSLPQLQRAAPGCQGCELYLLGGRTVFGEGPAGAPLMLVGEQPGHEEDLAGRPFVGPAGRILDEALRRAGIDRSTIYLTNAVKHFRFVARGKRRLHAKPGLVHIRACNPWLQAEVHAVKPRLVVALGATAVLAILGRGFTIAASRGRVLDGPQWAPRVVVTMHPSAVLRAPESDDRGAMLAALASDLKAAARAARQARGTGRLKTVERPPRLPTVRNTA